MCMTCGCCFSLHLLSCLVLSLMLCCCCTCSCWCCMCLFATAAAAAAAVAAANQAAHDLATAVSGGACGSMSCLAAKLRHPFQLCQLLHASCCVSGQHQQPQHQHQHQHQQRGLSSATQGAANQQQPQQPQHQLRGVLPATQGAANHQQVTQLQAERDALQQR